MKQLLKELVETPGPSGNEHKIRELIQEKIETHVDSMETDDYGNLIARKGEGDTTLMVIAHMDQIGLTVRRIDEKGYLKISKVGGMFETGVINQRVNVHTDEGVVKGIAAMKPPHIMDKDEKNSVPEMKKLFVDIGAEDDEDAKDIGVHVGDFITYDRSFEELGNDYVTGPAFDDRVGCAVLIEALKRFDEDYELVAVFSTQEEVGTKGARTSTFHIDPDVALAIDVGMAGDVPGIDPDESSDETGGGAGIDMQQAGGRGLIAPRKIRKWLIETGEENGNNYYRSLYDGGATDAASVELVRDGVPTGSIGVPTRHIHSPVEVVKMSDVEETVEFVVNSFSTLQEHF